ncbi:Calcineurin-like phosphoesterase [Nitrosospira briensis]|uniref:Calcineurin-like phosphoesterase n=1 Tax=Nitrosospira briensis TaxID=35799 RepID=A0A1I5CW38_9PROT|nr:metallophosphoesterase [Nitrosospira briensis]SFN91215.1 Calcineurin-like phosphoesterase [Nitrosospira briensis]
MKSIATLNLPQIFPHRIFVISDLHLGGEHPPSHQTALRGFRICTQTALLATFIRRVTQEGGTLRPCELVINGDFVDFLAEKSDDNLQWQPFITEGERAAKQLSLMIERDRIVFDALKDLLAAGHRLTILLGNHDAELSLLPVRQVLERELETDGKRFRFIFDGEAYVVGSIIIEHGNRYDGWNVVDYDGLRRTRSAQSRGEDLAQERAFLPPAGSIMVATVMNQIKEQFPFVDLLKPENEATLPLLLTLAPQYREHLMKVMKLAIRAQRHSLNSNGQPRYAGDITAHGWESTEVQLAHLLTAHVSDPEVSEFMELINRAAPPTLGGTEDEIASKGVVDYMSLFPIITTATSTPLASRLPALLTALFTLRDERSFDRSQEDEQYLEPARKLINRGFKVVVFGHTHLAKKVEIGESIYLNSGAWADLIRFPYDQLGQEREHALEWLSGFANHMERGEIKPYLLHMPTYVRIELDSGGTVLHADIHDFAEGQPIV